MNSTSRAARRAAMVFAVVALVATACGSSSNKAAPSTSAPSTSSSPTSSGSIAAPVTAGSKTTLATAKLQLGDASCAGGDTAYNRVRPTTTGQAGLGAPGATLLGGEDGDPFIDLLTSLGGDAFTYADTGGFGWVLNLLGGGQSKVDAAQIDSQLSAINSKLDTLAQDQYQDCEAILSALSAIKVQNDVNAYNAAATAMSTPVSYIVTYQQDYNQIVADLQQNGGHVNELSAIDKQDMVDMLSGDPTKGLRPIMNTMAGLEGGTQVGFRNMIDLYNQVLIDEAGYNPFQTHIFTAAFVDAAFAQADYYASMIDQAANLYANMAHLNFTLDGNTYPPNPDGIIQFVNIAQTDIHQWYVDFSDGPTGAGPAHWVSQSTNQSLAPIPADTVLDYRVQNHPMLWTDSPVALTGDPASPTPYYCATTAQFCYADFFNNADVQPPAGQATALASTRLVLPSAQPMTTRIAAADHDDLSGWRVPTTTDFNALQAGATGGLFNWGPTNHLDLFTPQLVPDQYGGMTHAARMIAPILVDTGTTGKYLRHYGVLTATNPTVNSLTLQQPYLGLSGENDEAGQLFLVLDYQPTAPPTPFSTQTVGHTKATPSTTAAKPTNHAAKSASAPPTSRPGPGRPAGADLAPTTFTTPTTCAADTTDPTYYTVPDGAAAVTITAAGGAGGPGTVAGKATSTGGLGGTVTETVPVTPGEQLYVQVGTAGGTGGAAGPGGGGTGGRTESLETGDSAGGGGGASGVSTTPDCDHWLVVGGGGGGGGSGLNVGKEVPLNGGAGGNGCATLPNCTAATDGVNDKFPGGQGRAGGTDPLNEGGSGGTNTEMSAPHGSNGSTLAGGNGGNGGPHGYQGGGGGGGGGGYFGGGGGGGGGFNGSGGGGGGGATWAIPGGSAIRYGAGTSGQNGSVTITPLPKTAPPIAMSVNTATSTTTVSWGQPIPLTATLPADATGDIGFYDDVNGGCDGHTGSGSLCQGLGTATLYDGTATLPNPDVPLDIGAHELHASWGGDTHYQASDSNVVTVTVTKAAPALTLSVSGTVLTTGQSPTSLVVQTPADASGTVTFSSDTNQVQGSAPIQGGYATLTSLSTTLAVGTHPLSASWPGDAHYNPGQSNPVVVTVSNPVNAKK